MVMFVIVRTTLVMFCFMVFVMESLPKPHPGQASGVCSSNFVGSGLLVTPLWPFCPPRGFGTLSAVPFCLPGSFDCLDFGFGVPLSPLVPDVFDPFFIDGGVLKLSYWPCLRFIP